MNLKPKEYTCKICKSKFTKKSSFQTWCSSDCGFALAKIKLDKEKKKQEIQKRKEWKLRKEKAKAELTGYRDPLQVAINNIVRLLDKDLPCIARPFEKTSFYDAGHVYSVGAYPALRYHVWNIHKQSVKSNRDMGGEQHLMFEGIEIRYGKERLDKIIALPQSYKQIKLQDYEKKEALRIANQIIREIEAGATITRDEVNRRLKIYPEF